MRRETRANYFKHRRANMKKKTFFSVKEGMRPGESVVKFMLQASGNESIVNQRVEREMLQGYTHTYRCWRLSTPRDTSGLKRHRWRHHDSLSLGTSATISAVVVFIAVACCSSRWCFVDYNWRHVAVHNVGRRRRRWRLITTRTCHKTAVCRHSTVNNELRDTVSVWQCRQSIIIIIIILLYLLRTILTESALRV